MCLNCGDWFVIIVIYVVLEVCWQLSIFFQHFKNFFMYKLSIWYSKFVNIGCVRAVRGYLICLHIPKNLPFKLVPVISTCSYCKPAWNLRSLGHLHQSFKCFGFTNFSRCLFLLQFFTDVTCNKKRRLEKFVKPKQYEDVPKTWMYKL